MSGKRGAIRSRGGPSAPPVQPVPSTAELFHAHALFVWRVLRRMGIAEADVDDVFQEVFVVAHRRLGDFEGRSSVQTWLYGICVRVASDYRKRARARSDGRESSGHQQAVAPSQEDDVAMHQARAELDRILGALDDEKRAVFVLYEIEELPMPEVAAAIGCPLQTAYWRLHAARREVEAMLTRLRAKEGPA